MAYRYRVTFALAAAILLLDQATKLLVEAYLPAGGMTVVPGLFNLVYVLNKGAAFGFLNRADIHWQTYFFIGASVLAVILILQLLRTVDRHDPLLFAGLGLILGGALGNLVDRIRIGMVIDFLDIHIGPNHWPAFNVADMAITVGSIALLITFFKQRAHASTSR
jgi:signal peptidase II